MIKKIISKKNQGFGMMEIIIVIGIIGLALAGIAGFSNFILKTNTKIKHEATAVYLAQEALEAARAVKEENWPALTVLTPGSPYHPAQSAGKWVISAGSESNNGYTRQIVLSNVSRDTNDDIVTSGGVDDPGTKKMTATVSWTDQGQNYQTVLSAYFTNWKP